MAEDTVTVSSFNKPYLIRIMKRAIGLLFFCALSASASAQLDLNALKQQSDAKAREQKQAGQDFLSERDAKWGEFMESRNEEWAKIIEKRDLEWSSFLCGSEWALFSDFLINEVPVKPKPVVAPKLDTEPVAEPNPEPIALPDDLIIKPNPKPWKDPGTLSQSVIDPVDLLKRLLDQSKSTPALQVPDNQVPLPCKPAEPLPDPSKKIEYSFYGHPVSIPYDNILKSFRYNKIGKDVISECWNSFSSSNYTPIVNALVNEKEKIGLDDWGYYLLVSEYATLMYQDKNCSNLLTWFLLVRSGLDAKVGYNDSGIVLLLPTETELFGKSFYKINDRNYYVATQKPDGGIYTYDGNYANGRQFSFGLKGPLRLGDNKSVRHLSFRFKGKEYDMDFAYDSDVIDYYKALPLAQFKVFFEASPSMRLKKSIEDNLKPIVSGMDRQTALNFLLQFVQYAFSYKTDNQQFGFEKYFYVEELFFYPYCDCEDRSVLFSYLAHELMGYDVVGTNFPGHMATAVDVDFNAKGVKYSAAGRTYTIADPTYVGAYVGQCMSKYETTLPQILFIDYSK